MPSQHVRILLSTCKWDREKLLERSVSCSFSPFNSAMTEASFFVRFYAGDQEALFNQAHLVHPHKKVLANIPTRVQATSTARCGAAASPGQEYICEICMLAYPHSEMAGLECGHLFCHECWDSYLRVMVVCEGRAQTISCPATACDIVVDETTVLYVVTILTSSLFHLPLIFKYS